MLKIQVNGFVVLLSGTHVLLVCIDRDRNGRSTHDCACHLIHHQRAAVAAVQQLTHSAHFFFLSLKKIIKIIKELLQEPTGEGAQSAATTATAIASTAASPSKQPHPQPQHKPKKGVVLPDGSFIFKKKSFVYVE